MLLLPPDMREWLPDGHLVWLVLDVVEQVDTSAFHVDRRLGGAGRRGWDPDMLVALLLYCYCQGERSSRRIEQLCRTDVACRVVTGGQAPDHCAIARFRAANEAAFTRLFADVLAVCARAGMGRLGTVALDGTKMRANASRLANRTRVQLAEEAGRIVAEAAAADAAEDARFGCARGDELPEALAPGAGRLGRLRKALAALDAEQAQAPPVRSARERIARAEATVRRERDRRQALLDERARRHADAAEGGGQPKPRAVMAGDTAVLRRAREQLSAARTALGRAEQRAETTQRGHPRRANMTDPDSRLLRAQGAWVQGYNAQAAVTGDGVIVACAVGNNPTDAVVFEPMLQRIEAARQHVGIAEPVGLLLADAGYDSVTNLTCPGPDRLIPPRPGHHSAAAQQMRQRLATPDGRRTYQQRGRIEAVFGDLKHNQRADQFTRRGLDAAESEWHLICTAHNLRALHRRRRH